MTRHEPKTPVVLYTRVSSERQDVNLPMAGPVEGASGIRREEWLRRRAGVRGTVGVNVAAGSGVALAVGSGVGVGAGVGVGSGPTRMAVWPLTGVSDLSKSSMIPEKGYVFISAGAVTGYVKLSSPSRMKATFWSSTSTAVDEDRSEPL